MARLPLLFAVLGWLAVGHAQEQLQHVLNDDPMTPHPLPQAAELVRKKLVSSTGPCETSRAYHSMQAQEGRDHPDRYA